jgi:hypothetical protein
MRLFIQRKSSSKSSSFDSMFFIYRSLKPVLTSSPSVQTEVIRVSDRGRSFEFNLSRLFQYTRVKTGSLHYWIGLHEVVQKLREVQKSLFWTGSKHTFNPIIKFMTHTLPKCMKEDIPRNVQSPPENVSSLSLSCVFITNRKDQ